MDVQCKDRLVALRKAASLTQSKAAELAGLHRVRLSRLETGTLQCHALAVRESLARAYGVSLGDLDGYLEGEIALDQLVVAHSPPPRPYPERRSSPPERRRRAAARDAPWLGLDADEIEGETELELRIEERFRQERIAGGADRALHECTDDAIYFPGGDEP